MLSIRTGTLGILLLAVLYSSVHGVLRGAIDLVESMQLDVAVLDSMQWSVRRAVNERRLAVSVYECLRAKDHRRFTVPLANHIASTLNGQEIAVALSFYSSPAGRKYTAYGFVDAHRGFDPKVDEPYPTFDPEDKTALHTFAATSAGDKLIRQQVLTSPAMPESVAEVQLQLLHECGYRLPR